MRAGRARQFSAATPSGDCTACRPGRPCFDPRDVNEKALEYYGRLRRVRDYVQCHAAEPITLSKAAGVAGLERTYFSTFFHRKVGVRFKDWLALVRVQRAMQEFRTADFTVTEVALSSGFDDLRTFERAFRKCARVSPNAYRKSVRPR